MGGIKVRLALAGLVGAMALGMVAAQVAEAGTTACRVRNLTQGTAGTSFQVMVTAARDGDRLTLRGACEGNVRIDKDVLVRGTGVAPAIIGNGRGSVVHVLERARVVLVRLSIRGGGTGLLVAGSVRLRDVTVGGNAVADQDGGGIHNSGTMTIITSRVVENAADGAASGAGIFNQGTMTVVDSVIATNEATFYSSGGGIYNEGTLSLVRSIVRGNTSEEGGGGIYNEGTLSLEDTSVSDNTDDGAGGRNLQRHRFRAPRHRHVRRHLDRDRQHPRRLLRHHRLPGCSARRPGGSLYVAGGLAIQPSHHRARRRFPARPFVSPGPDVAPTSSPAPDPCASPSPSPSTAPDTSPPVPEGSPPADAG